MLNAHDKRINAFSLLIRKVTVSSLHEQMTPKTRVSVFNAGWVHVVATLSFLSLLGFASLTLVVALHMSYDQMKWMLTSLQRVRLTPRTLDPCIGDNFFANVEGLSAQLPGFGTYNRCTYWILWR